MHAHPSWCGSDAVPCYDLLWWKTVLASTEYQTWVATETTKIDMIEPFYLFTTFYAPCFLHLIKSHPFPLALLNLRFSVDGNLVASASDDSLVFVWKPMDGTMVACHEHPMAVAWIEIDCCSSTWFRKSVQWLVPHVWVWRDLKLVVICLQKCLPFPMVFDLYSVCFFALRIVVSNFSSVLSVYHIFPPSICQLFSVFEVLSCSFADDGHLATGCSDGKLRIWSTAESEPVELNASSNAKSSLRGIKSATFIPA